MRPNEARCGLTVDFQRKVLLKIPPPINGLISANTLEIKTARLLQLPFLNLAQRNGSVPSFGRVDP